MLSEAKTTLAGKLLTTILIPSFPILLKEPLPFKWTFARLANEAMWMPFTLQRSNEICGNRLLAPFAPRMMNVHMALEIQGST